VTTRDEDILDFDFFGEEEPPSWEEPTERGPGPPRDRPPRRRGPRFTAPGNLTPLLRLVALISLAILIVVLLAVWVEGCTTNQKRERYQDYTTDVGEIGNASARLGNMLASTLTTPALKLEDLDAKLGGFVQTAENQVARAEDLGAPGPMHNPHQGAIEALRYRVNGLRGLQTAFQETADAQDASVAGQQIAAQMQRLVSSDIIWTDSFRGPAEAVLASESVEGIDVPTSEFVAADEIATPEALAAIWQRIQGAADGGTTGGLHGSGIAYVRALPSGTDLSTTTETTLLVTDQLAFEVGVEDTGDSQEVQIKVTLTIPSTPDPIVQEKTIPLIDPGETKAVRFQVGTLVPFGETVSVKVDVDPVQGETNTTNNTAEYPVIFSLATTS
jgi:CARDB